MSAGWIVTRDFTADLDAPEGTNANAVGVIGPGGYDGGTSKEELPILFYMYDDDGERYYGGRMNEDALDSYGEGGDPLYCFGMPNAGCTELRIQTPGDPGWTTV